jgi:hypothetical protein
MSSIPMVGVPLRTKVIAVRPTLCSELSFLGIVTFCAAWHQTAEPYVSIGIITPSYNHLVYIGLGLQVRLGSGRILISAFLHDAIFCVMCGDQFNLESMTTPNIFVSFTLGT